MIRDRVMLRRCGRRRGQDMQHCIAFFGRRALLGGGIAARLRACVAKPLRALWAKDMSASPRALHGAERFCNTIPIRSAREGYCAAQGESEMIANARDLSSRVFAVQCFALNALCLAVDALRSGCSCEKFRCKAVASVPMPLSLPLCRGLPFVTVPLPCSVAVARVGVWPCSVAVALVGAWPTSWSSSPGPEPSQASQARVSCRGNSRRAPSRGCGLSSRPHR